MLIVGVEAGDAARSLARDGAAVVVIGEATRAGAIAADIEQAGGRASVFVGDLADDDDRAALAEMVDELFSSGDA